MIASTLLAIWYLWLASLVSVIVALGGLFAVAWWAKVTRHPQSVMIQSSRKR